MGRFHGQKSHHKQKITKQNLPYWWLTAFSKEIFFNLVNFPPRKILRHEFGPKITYWVAFSVLRAKD